MQIYTNYKNKFLWYNFIDEIFISRFKKQQQKIDIFNNNNNLFKDLTIYKKKFTKWKLIKKYFDFQQNFLSIYKMIKYKKHGIKRYKVENQLPDRDDRKTKKIFVDWLLLKIVK